MIEAWAISFALILVRIATFWTMVPMWSSLKPPRLVKLGLVVSLSFFWLLLLKQPLAVATTWSQDDLHWFFLVYIAIGEILTGGILAVAFHVFLVPLQVAGAYIGQELGLSMATLTDSSNGQPNNIFSTMLLAFGTVAFFILDLHHYLLFCLHASFRILPPGEMPRMESITTLIGGFADLTTQGLLMCSPIAIVSFLSLVTLLVLTRTAPSLNLFSIGIPIRLLIGLVALLFLLPLLVASMHRQFEYGIDFIKTLLQSL